MSANELREILGREPLQPFRVRLTSGDAYEIHNPHLAVAMRNRVFIAIADSDRWTFVPYLHIAAVGAIGNGRPRRTPTQVGGPPSGRPAGPNCLPAPLRLQTTLVRSAARRRCAREPSGV